MVGDVDAQCNAVAANYRSFRRIVGGLSLFPDLGGEIQGRRHQNRGSMEASPVSHTKEEG